MKITEVAYFLPRLRLCINFDKIYIGLLLGDFFTNSSGHPGPNKGSGFDDASKDFKKMKKVFASAY
jgi:hypothetical protein